MLNFKEISLKDKAFFDYHLKAFYPRESEMNFTNLFMWRKFYQYRYTEINGLICGIATPQNMAPFAFIPFGEMGGGPFTDTVEKIKEYFIEQEWCLEFRGITENELDYFKNVISNKEEDVVFDRDDCDYVYLREDLASLKGKKYDGKRNHLNNFKKNHDFEYIPLTKDYIGECYRIMDEWCSKRNCEEHLSFYCEKLANAELLDNFEILGCKGALIKVDGNYEAFTIGEILNRDTAVIHIEKANSSIDGLYPLVNQMFCQMEWGQVKYINREQDLGIEGLRKSKLSYHPFEILKKHVVYIR